MKRNALVVAGLLVLALSLAPRASADTYSRGNSDHPLRYIAYVLHPLGVALEYFVTRPFHTLISRDPGPEIFGHEATPQDKFPGWRQRKIVRNEAAYQALCPVMGPKQSSSYSGASGAKGLDAPAACGGSSAMAQPEKSKH